MIIESVDMSWEYQTFPDGEIHMQLEQKTAEKIASSSETIFFFCSITGDEAFFRVVDQISVLHALGAEKRLKIIVRYMAYMTQEKGCTREALKGLTRLKILEAQAKESTLAFVEPHLNPMPIKATILEVPWERILTQLQCTNPVLVAMDEGAVKRITLLGTKTGLPVILLSKTHTGWETVESTIGISTGIPSGPRTYIFIDDMIRSGKTILSAVKELFHKSLGDDAIAIAAHPRFTVYGVPETLRVLKAIHVFDTIGFRNLHNSTVIVDIHKLYYSDLIAQLT